MLATYINKNLKISPRKLRLLVNSIKTLKPKDAVDRLRFTNTKAARILVKAIKNIIATSQNNYHLLPETLEFDTLWVDDGPRIKRMDKSHGARFARGIIQKRHSRLTITLSGTSDTIPQFKKPARPIETSQPKVSKIKKTK